MPSILRKLVIGWVDGATRRPLAVVFAALIFIALCGAYIRKLELRSDLLQLLPRDSPGFRAFEHQLGRVGGGSSLIVVVESPDPVKNQHFIDDLSAALEQWRNARLTCISECRAAPCEARCGADTVAYVESGTRDVREFFEKHKWLYTTVADLEEIDETLDFEIARSSGLVEDLESEELSGSSAAPAPKSALGLDGYRERLEAKAKEQDDFPTGYFRTPDGGVFALRIVSKGTLGDASGDRLLDEVKSIVASLGPERRAVTIGYAGDIPNAAEEKASLATEAASATLVAVFLILTGVVFYFRSVGALVVIALPVFVGVAGAYAFATARYGYINSAGAFLGAIILGNGINYPIVLLARYREFVARGEPRDLALRNAVLNAFRAELVGACVAAIAYGSLTVTRFRGFSQFGAIGFVGMLLVWLAIVPLVPALIVLEEWFSRYLSKILRPLPLRWNTERRQGVVIRWIAQSTAKAPVFFLVVSSLVAVGAVWPLPRFFKDPWEYDFGKLGSRGSKVSGSGEWSNKADRVFGGRTNMAGALMLADTPEQVPMIQEAIFKNDAADPQGQLIAGIATIEDYLPGTIGEQKGKLAILERIRNRLTPAVINRLTPDERQRVNDLRPPNTLEVLRSQDLPMMLQRRFAETNGTLGTVFYVKPKNEVSLSDGRIQLRFAKTTDNVVLPDGTQVLTASRSTIFAEMIHSMERDGPVASLVSLGAVIIVVVLATSNFKGAVAVLMSLLLGVLVTLGGAAYSGLRLHYVNFIALPITFGIGCEYPFNIYDRTRLLRGDINGAVTRSGGAIILCSYTTIIGYGSLLYSDFQALESFGQLAVCGEIACLFGALFFLPALLHRFKSSGVAGSKETTA